MSVTENNTYDWATGGTCQYHHCRLAPDRDTDYRDFHG